MSAVTLKQKSRLVAVCGALAAAVVLGAWPMPGIAAPLNIGGVDGTGATIKGVVKFDGRQAKRKALRMSADAYCDQAHKGSPARNERYIFGENDTLVNVFVWVSKGLEGQSFPDPEGAATIDQQGCMYVPHVRGVVVNQALKILNSDNTLHNVKMNSSNNGSFNEGMPVKGMELNKKLTKPEVGVPFKCDVHPWMSAYVHVVEHPFFAVTGQDGTFEIRGLPAGEYQLSVWHEFDKFVPDQAVVDVVVGEGDTKEVTYTYSPKKKK